MTTETATITANHRTRDGWTPFTVTVGDYLSYTLVTDTVVVEVIKVTDKGIVVRRTKTGDVVRRDFNGGPYPVVYAAAVPNPDGATKRVMLSKEGRFKVAGSTGGRSTYRPATTIDGVPVTRVDLSF